MAENPELSAKMSRLLCIHGIGKVTAFSLLCEVYDFERFRKGSAFASYLGLVPSERSSGERSARGRITGLGNANLRRLLIEAAGCYGAGANIAAAKRAGVPALVAARAQECTDRLLGRRKRLGEKGLAANKAKCAVARELAEWVYYIMVMPA